MTTGCTVEPYQAVRRPRPKYLEPKSEMGDVPAHVVNISLSTSDSSPCLSAKMGSRSGFWAYHLTEHNEHLTEDIRPEKLKALLCRN